MTADGTIIIAGESQRVYALWPDGTERWVFSISGSGKFLGGVTLGPDGTIYVAEDSRWVHAIELTSGQRLQSRIHGRQSGHRRRRRHLHHQHGRRQ